MTELLNRPDQELTQSVESQIDPATLQTMYEVASPEETPEQTIDPREISSTGASIVRAAQRINNLLERRAINKAHGEALDEYRDRDHSGYIDHLANMKDSQEATPVARATAEMALEAEHRRADRKEMADKAKTMLRGFGSSALAHLKNAGRVTVSLPAAAAEASVNGVKRANEAMGDAVMAGFEKAEAGMDVVGNKLADTKVNIKAGYQTYQFNRETKSNQKQFQKAYAKETKAFDKEAKSEQKLQAKVDKWESKFAAQEDRRFERDMRKKAAQERREARHVRWAERRAMIKEAIISTSERTGDAMMSGFVKLENGLDKVGNVMIRGKEAAGAKVERGKTSIHTTRAAGRAAIEAFKATRQAHTEQNKLY